MDVDERFSFRLQVHRTRNYDFVVEVAVDFVLDEGVQHGILVADVLTSGLLVDLGGFQVGDVVNRPFEARFSLVGGGGLSEYRGAVMKSGFRVDKRG